MVITITCARPGCDNKKETYPNILKRVTRSFCSRSCQAKFYNPTTPGLRAARKRHRAPWLREQNLAVNSIKGKKKEVSAQRINGRRAHRVIAERKIRRKLKRGEVVHHKNGDYLDNRPSNLKVMSRSAHISLHQKDRYDDWKNS